MSTTVRRPGSRRAVPRGLDATQRARLQQLLDDPDTWVLRSSWEAFLQHGSDATLVATNELAPGHRAAALAWLRQQRHALHRELVGGQVAPDGWLESLPLVQRLESLGPIGPRRHPLPPDRLAAAGGDRITAED